MLEYITYRIIVTFNYFIIGYVVILSAINAMQMFLSLIYASAYTKKAVLSNVRKYSKSSNIVPISILVPAYNEEATVVENIKSLLALNYANYEVVVINDGSKDDTLSKVISAFDLKMVTYPMRAKIKTNEVRGIYYNPEHPKLHLIDKVNGGKADALNVGINFSNYPYFVSIDADSLLDSDALIRIALSFMEYKYTIAVGGIIRVANGSKVVGGKVISLALPRNSVALFQIVEYFRAFLVGRMGWSIFDALLIISGAFGAFEKDAVLKVGGYTVGTVGEDMDLVMKLHMFMRKKKYKYKINFLPDPICWTQVPETVRDLFGQRRRWQIGLIDSLKNGREMFLNPRFGVLGMMAMPYFVFFELLGPVIEAAGLVIIPLSYLLHMISLEFFLLFLIATTLFGVVLSVGALAIEEHTFNKYVQVSDFLLLSFYSIIENFGYRQMTVYFRLMGLLQYRKYKHAWGKIKRKTFESSS